MNKRDIITTVGLIFFILGVCGYDGQPVVCGIVSLIGLMVVYVCQRSQREKETGADAEMRPPRRSVRTSQ